MKKLLKLKKIEKGLPIKVNTELEEKILLSILNRTSLYFYTNKEQRTKFIIINNNEPKYISKEEAEKYRKIYHFRDIIKRKERRKLIEKIKVEICGLEHINRNMKDICLDKTYEKGNSFLQSSKAKLKIEISLLYSCLNLLNFKDTSHNLSFFKTIYYLKGVKW